MHFCLSPKAWPRFDEIEDVLADSSEDVFEKCGESMLIEISIKADEWASSRRKQFRDELQKEMMDLIIGKEDL